MNRDKMLEALAEAIGAAILGKTAKRGGIDAAAAVLDLCGPEPLVWGPDHDGRGFIAVSSSGKQYASFDEGSPRWALALGGGFGYHYFPAGSIEAAQAAAQSHATAAHWSNTPLGKLLGVV